MNKDGETARILVVDDEERIREACRMVLEEEGYRVDVADSGSLGLEMMERDYFDVILLDLMMPELSGLDVLPGVTELHPDTAVIIITGYATLEHSIEAMKKGAFDFVPKPFSPDDLRAVVSKAIKYTRALQDISDSKSRLRVMVNRLTDGVLTTDSKRNIVLANPAFLHMIGYSGGDVTGMAVEKVVAQRAIVDILDSTLAATTESFSESIKELSLEGQGSEEERIVSVHCSPYMSRGGQSLGTTMVLHDITAMKKMDQMKSDFVSMVSHEIRSPMNSLLAQLKIVLDGLAGEVTSKQREILERASGKINNLVNLVTELLDLAKIEAGLSGKERQLLNVEGLIREQVEFHQAEADRKNIALDYEFDHLPEILADPAGLEEVLTNLITNAVKYSPERTRIMVSAMAEGESLVIKVIDTGFGIPEEDLAEIFTRFYRVKDKNTREIHGTGLGLSIVKSIIDAHQGSIRVESTLDVGTTFIVTLPIEQ